MEKQHLPIFDPSMQSNASLIKKLMMHNDFIGKNLCFVGRAKLSSTSVVFLKGMHQAPGEGTYRAATMP